MTAVVLHSTVARSLLILLDRATQVFSELARIGPAYPPEEEETTHRFPFRTYDCASEPHPGLRSYPFLSQVGPLVRGCAAAAAAAVDLLTCIQHLTGAASECSLTPTGRAFRSSPLVCMGYEVVGNCSHRVLPPLLVLLWRECTSRAVNDLRARQHDSWLVLWTPAAGSVPVAGIQHDSRHTQSLRTAPLCLQ